MSAVCYVGWVRGDNGQTIQPGDFREEKLLRKAPENTEKLLNNKSKHLIRVVWRATQTPL